MVVFSTDEMGHARWYFTDLYGKNCRKGILFFDFGFMLSYFCTS